MFYNIFTQLSGAALQGTCTLNKLTYYRRVCNIYFEPFETDLSLNWPQKSPFYGKTIIIPLLKQELPRFRNDSWKTPCCCHNKDTVVKSSSPYSQSGVVSVKCKQANTNSISTKFLFSSSQLPNMFRLYKILKSTIFLLTPKMKLSKTVTISIRQEVWPVLFYHFLRNSLAFVNAFFYTVLDSFAAIRLMEQLSSEWLSPSKLYSKIVKEKLVEP